MPFKGARIIMMSLGIASLIMSIVNALFYIFVFGGLANNQDIREWMLISFIVKAITWSPFLGIEMYDMLFENIYHDV